MGDQAGGNARFKGPGSLWKSGWKGRRTFSQLCCVGGFGAGAEGQFYENADGPLDISVASGWWIAAVVALRQVPVGIDPIAMNRSAPNEGWELVAFDQTVDPDVPTVGLRLNVYDGAGVAATAETPGVQLINLETIGGVIFVVVGAAVAPPTVGAPNGTLFLGPAPPTGVPLANPYVNTDPHLFVGGDGTEVFEAPNCIAGLVGGVGLYDADGAFVSQFNQQLSAWEDQIRAANQIVLFPDSGTPIPGFANTNGWRIDGPAGAAPSPLEDFVGSDPLTYGNLAAGPLQQGCESPLVFWPDNLAYPLGNP